MILLPHSFLKPAPTEDPGGGFGVPYLDAAWDGLVSNAPSHTPWTLRSNGRIETWHSLNGNFTDPTFGDNAIALPHTGGEFDAWNAANVMILDPLEMLAPPVGIVMMLKCYGSASTYYRIIGENAASPNQTRGFFLWPNNSDFDLEKQTSTTGAAWRDGGSGPMAGTDRANWNALGLLLPSTGSPPRLWVNGSEQTRTVANYTAPAQAYHAIGHTGLFREFYVGELLFYDDPSGAEMAAHTLACFNRWNP